MDIKTSEAHKTVYSICKNIDIAIKVNSMHLSLVFNQYVATLQL